MVPVPVPVFGAGDEITESGRVQRRRLCTAGIAEDEVEDRDRCVRVRAEVREGGRFRNRSRVGARCYANRCLKN